MFFHFLYVPAGFKKFEKSCFSIFVCPFLDQTTLKTYIFWRVLALKPFSSDYARKVVSNALVKVSNGRLEPELWPVPNACTLIIVRARTMVIVNTCMYHDHSTCIYYDHSTCMYYDHRIFEMFHSSGSRRPFDILTSTLDVIFRAQSIEYGFRANTLQKISVIDVFWAPQGPE